MAEPRIRVSAILRWRGSVLLCRHEKGDRHYWLLSQAIAHRTGEVPTFEPLEDDLEAEAHEVSARRARTRGGRY